MHKIIEFNTVTEFTKTRLSKKEEYILTDIINNLYKLISVNIV